MLARFKHAVRDALGAELPRRLAQARQHPRYAEALRCDPPAPGRGHLAPVTGVLASIVAGLWALALTEGGELWTVASTGSALCAAYYSWRWSELRDMRSGRIRRQLYVVLDKRALRVGRFARYTVTLWRPALEPIRLATSRSLYDRCDVGNAGLAVFRGKHLMELRALAPLPGAGARRRRGAVRRVCDDHGLTERSDPRLRGSPTLLHPAAAGATARLDEPTGMSWPRI
jgi:hypothetical protein